MITALALRHVADFLGFSSVIAIALGVIWLDRKGIPADVVKRTAVKSGAIAGALCPTIIILLCLPLLSPHALRFGKSHPILVLREIYEVPLTIPLGAMIGAAMGWFLCSVIQWINKIKRKNETGN